MLLSLRAFFIVQGNGHCIRINICIALASQHRKAPTFASIFLIAFSAMGITISDKKALKNTISREPTAHFL